MKFETQEKALRVICTASRGGTEPVDAQKMASLLGVTPVTAPLNNRFFMSLGLLETRDRGEYVPTQLALAYQQKWTFDKNAAAALLAPAFTGTWFYEAVEQRLSVGTATREQIVEMLATLAHTDNSYATQYGLLLDWLEYAGLIRIIDGMISLTKEQSFLSPFPPAPTPKPDKPNPETLIRTPEEPKRPQGASIIAMSFTVNVTADDLARLSAEQIAALFEGVGKIAAVKAALEKN